MVSHASYKNSYLPRVNLSILIAAMALALIVMSPEIASAQNAGSWSGEYNVLKKSCSFLVVVKTFFFNALYLLGAIGLGVIAVRAYMGQFSFKSLFALGGGVFLVAVADLVISFLTEDQGSSAGAVECITGST